MTRISTRKTRLRLCWLVLPWLFCDSMVLSTLISSREQLHLVNVTETVHYVPMTSIKIIPEKNCTYPLRCYNYSSFDWPLVDDFSYSLSKSSMRNKGKRSMKEKGTCLLLSCSFLFGRVNKKKRKKNWLCQWSSECERWWSSSIRYKCRLLCQATGQRKEWEGSGNCNRFLTASAKVPADIAGLLWNSS